MRQIKTGHTSYRPIFKTAAQVRADMDRTPYQERKVVTHHIYANTFGEDVDAVKKYWEPVLKNAKECPQTQATYAFSLSASGAPTAEIIQQAKYAHSISPCDIQRSQLENLITYSK